MGALKATRISGRSGSGKTHALLADMQAAALAGTPRGAIALVIPIGPSLAELRERLRALDARADEYRILTFGDLAFDILAALPVRVVDDVEAAGIFATVAQAALEFGPLDASTGELDPEVSGLRSPERFTAAAFALIGKLRAACIDPDEFERICMRGATTFYSNPPNFADIDLLLATKDAHRGSLSVDATELERQRQREIDLAKILGGLYRTYMQHFGTSALPQRDLVPAALAQVRADTGLRAKMRSAIERLYIDDAQECTVAEFALTRELIAENPSRLWFAFDDRLTIGAFSGARPRQWLELDAQERTLEDHSRVPAEIARLALDFATKAATLDPGEDSSAVTIYHTMEKAGEAAYIADRVAALIAAGAVPESIAIVLRTLQTYAPYERALLDRDVPLDVEGDVSPLRGVAALDALAALWVATDPFRHEWLLRFLQAPPFGFSDSALAILSSPAPSAQASLFEGDPAPAAAPRIDRSIRLGTHVFGGDVDDFIPPEAQVKLEWLRAAAREWHALRERVSLSRFAERVIRDVGFPVAAGNAARTGADARALARLLERIEQYEWTHPGARLDDFLTHAQSLANSEHAHTSDDRGADCVQLLSVAAARGRTFDHVFIANVHAGAFPRYYTPDAFLFSPSLGIIAKDNAGGMHAARTAKFTYYDFRYKPSAAYYEHERRMCALAMLRARKSLTISACERLTRGIGAPEFLNELRTLRPACARS